MATKDTKDTKGLFEFRRDRSAALILLRALSFVIGMSMAFSPFGPRGLLMIPNIILTDEVGVKKKVERLQCSWTLKCG